MTKYLTALIFTLLIGQVESSGHSLFMEAEKIDQPTTFTIPDGADQATVARALAVFGEVDPEAKQLEKTTKIARSMSTGDLRHDSELLDKKLDILTTYQNETQIKQTINLIYWTSFHENFTRKGKAVAYGFYAAGIICWGMNFVQLPCDVQSGFGVASGITGLVGAAIHYLAYKSQEAYQERSKMIQSGLAVSKQTAGILDRELASRADGVERLIPEDLNQSSRIWSMFNSVSDRLNEVTSALRDAGILSPADLPTYEDAMEQGLFPNDNSKGKEEEVEEEEHEDSDDVVASLHASAQSVNEDDFIVVDLQDKK